MEKIKQFSNEHPQIIAWLVLSIGMVMILIYSAQDVGFEARQWIALVITTILLAGACVWIIGWDDDEEEKSE